MPRRSAASSAAARRPSAPPALLHQWPRGPWNELHKAAHEGSANRAKSLLSKGFIDINQGGPTGWTALHCGAEMGHSGVVEFLLKNGASTSIASDNGKTALHVSSHRGHLVVTKLLVKAGADLEASSEDCTPLRMAAEGGHADVMWLLIRAGANPNTRLPNGETPLYTAALRGHLEAVRVLLRAKACALLTTPDPAGMPAVPLDAAANHNRVEVVRELLRQLGIEGCAGSGGGLIAINLTWSIRVVRLLVDAGVDTKQTFKLMDDPEMQGEEYSTTVLAFKNRCIRDKHFCGQDTTEEMLNGLQGIRRLLLRVEAVHAVSWLWCTGSAYIARAADGTRKSKLLSPPVSSMLPFLMRRAARTGVLWGPMFRYSVKP